MIPRMIPVKPLLETTKDIERLHSLPEVRTSGSIDVPVVYSAVMGMVEGTAPPLHHQAAVRSKRIHHPKGAWWR